MDEGFRYLAITIENSRIISYDALRPNDV